MADLRKPAPPGIRKPPPPPAPPARKPDLSALEAVALHFAAALALDELRESRPTRRAMLRFKIRASKRAAQ